MQALNGATNPGTTVVAPVAEVTQMMTLGTNARLNGTTDPGGNAEVTQAMID